ncbi:hypothetical protein V8E55_006356 [Tylopilus felleus]
MYLAGNISDLLIFLWCSNIDTAPDDNKATWDWAVLTDDVVWTSHGQDVASAGKFLPENQHAILYKMWEFQLYTFGVTPILLYDILPLKYWSNYCQFVRGFQIMCQHSLTHEQLEDAHVLLCTWERDFELMYYQLHHNRIHFLCPVIHQVIHLVPEAFQKDPPICYAQWTMERTIRNLGQQIRQPSKPYANLAQEGYVLLCKHSRYPISPDDTIAQAIRNYLPAGQDLPRFEKWAWETLESEENLRISRNVKFINGTKVHTGEVQYFTCLAISNPEEEWSFSNSLHLPR